MLEPAVLTRREYAVAVDAVDRFPPGVTKGVMQQMLGCIASYRTICHHLAPLLHDAIAECDDKQELQHLRDVLKQLQRGES